VHFSTSCSPTVQPQFERAVALLHSFWFDEGSRHSAPSRRQIRVARWPTGKRDAHVWKSVRLATFSKALADGGAAVERAKAAQAKSQRERDYIGAIEAFYKDWDKVDHRTRALAYANAMEQLARRYPRTRKRPCSTRSCSM